MKRSIITATLAIVIALATIGGVAGPKVAAADPGRWHAHHHGKMWKAHDRHHRKIRKAHQRQHRHIHKHVRKHHHVHRTVHHEHVTYTPASSSGISAETGGRVIGGILGAVVGSQIGKGKGKVVGVLGGGLLGFLLGGEVGKSMDASDQARTQNALETTRTGETASWSNPDTGVTYNVTPTVTYESNNGAPCREYTTWVFIDGFEEEAHGTACRQDNGTWKTVNGDDAEDFGERG